MSPETESTFRSIVNRAPAIETDRLPSNALADLILQSQLESGDTAGAKGRRPATLEKPKKETSRAPAIEDLIAMSQILGMEE